MGGRERYKQDNVREAEKETPFHQSLNITSLSNLIPMVSKQAPTNHLCNPRRFSLFVFLLLVLPIPTTSNLSLDFYSYSCPDLEMLVKNAVRSESSFDPTLPGKLLRLLFHDCMVEGCDGSVLIDGDGTERSDPANTSLGGLGVVGSIKKLIDVFCPDTVSCADVLVLVARDAVEMAGGPAVEVPMGRRDGRVSLVSNVRSNMVDTSFTIDEMIRLFASKGLSLEDLVALSGAHTIGSAHCSAFSDRFKEDSNGKLTPIDRSLDKAYADQLTNQCPADASTSITVSNDPETPQVFDNQFYRNLLAGKGLFQSDSVLFTDGRTKEMVEEFSESQEIFFERWAASFIKLTTVGVKTGNEGEIRRVCNLTNG
ncbi:peroxidase 18-like [Magnolia sinica]|uniref:peroxidase 18-like n=1 Tax=Magnolia sinica TaxID=86752 RepID=UPI0026586C23|nr:peroxidase 18-like [Magnolia sinica]